MASERKPVTAPELVAKKARGERIVMVTAYDYPSARFADSAGVDAILVGDSLGMVVQGCSTTLPVTMDEMVYHTRAVGRAQPAALIIADMPFLSYQASADDAVRNAGRLLKEGGASAVKLEGGTAVAPLVERLVAAGIPVMGHLGMTPQSVRTLGGFRVQARQADHARQLLSDACALSAAGAFGMVLEGIPAEVSRAVTDAVPIPTIGIGAGPDCDGEVQVFHDLLGLFDQFTPRHTRRYAEIGRAIQEALSAYADDVRSGAFPGEANTYHQRDLEDPSSWRS
ncbi:MAG TPA: 3-methyl-2-oxobutanoate hydroxymethyltransferase [Armatimonadota bacterium]|nr:3-methyl-2-oxobutanoate hydroxymethyltransferase [Armatimonadota bacterium]